MILVPLEHWGVVIHVLHLDAEAEVGGEAATVHRPYQKAVPLLRLVIQSPGQIELAGAGVYPEQVVAVLAERVADRVGRDHVRVDGVRHVEGRVKGMRFRHGDSDAARRERRPVVVHVLHVQLHLPANTETRRNTFLYIFVSPFQERFDSHLTVARRDSISRLHAQNILVPRFSVQRDANSNHTRDGVHA